MKTLITEEDKSNSYSKKGGDLAEFSIIVTDDNKDTSFKRYSQNKKKMAGMCKG